jgi:hypothetical protein
MRELVSWAVVIVVTSVTAAFGAELAVPRLTINGQVHSNVVVSPSSKGRLMVRHETGIATVKIADLEYDVLKQLSDAEIIGGSAVKDLLAKKAPKIPKSSSNSTNDTEMVWQGGDVSLSANASALARAARVRLENEARALGIEPPDIEKSISTLSLEVGLGILGGFVLLYLLRCWCLFRICQRATGRGSILVFAPLLRWFPLADAAKMSRHWLAVPVFALFGLYLPPLLSQLPQLPWLPLAYLSVVCALWLVTVILFVVWCIRICKTLQHSAFVGFLLMLPIVDWLALLYVACSGKGSSGRISLNTSRAAI